MDDLITPQQAASLLGVTSHQVRHLIRKKKLKATKFGMFYLLRKQDLKDIQWERTPWKSKLSEK